MPHNDLLMLRMELQAMRDRLVADLDAALAKVDRALPPPENDRTREMARWSPAQWRDFYKGRSQ